MPHAQLVQLKDIATVRLGYPFRSSIENIRLDGEEEQKGMIGVIQMKDFDEYNRLDWSDVYKVQIKDLDKSHLLQPGDIVFRSRGVSNTAALVTNEMQQIAVDRCVASAALMVIRLRTNKIDPAYLCWYINHPNGQREISRLARGTNQQMVSKAALETLTLPLLPLEKQKMVVELAALSLREQEILSELTQKRKIYSDRILGMMAQNQLNLETE